MTYSNMRAVVLVHDRDPVLAFRNIGTLAPELRERGYELDVHSFDYGRGEGPPSLDGVGLIVVMGSPDAAYDDELPWIGPEIGYLRSAVDAGVPILGVCFGGQLLARVLGGSVTKSQRPEHGFTEVTTADEKLIGSGPWMEFHGDTFLAPADATVIARNDAGQQAFTFGPHLGLQFHPEIDADTFESWADAWARDGIHQDPDLVALVRAELAADETAVRARCGELLDAWLRASRPRLTGASRPPLTEVSRPVA